MTRNTYLTLLASLFLVACQPTTTPESQDSTFVVIKGATVIDGVSSTPIENAVIVIEGDTIQQAFQTMSTAELPIYRALLRSDDASEGISAFVEKRKADLKGK